MAQGTQIPITARFRHAAPSEHPSLWNACWGEQDTPWDRGGPSWALHDLLRQRPGLFSLPGPGPGPGPRKTALVPGCGTGYDALLLSAFGFDVCGLDVSPGATAAAKRHAAEAAAGAGEEAAAAYEPRDGVRRGAVTWLTGNFFEDGWLEQLEASTGRPAKFDLIFDYTFFCALPPSRRPAWARRIVDLLSSDGRLVCLEFPSGKSPLEPGPPWAAPPHAYEAYLSSPGATVPVDEQGGVLMGQGGSRREDGLRRLAHLKPSRTHASGTKDGIVQDYISVWSH